MIPLLAIFFVFCVPLAVILLIMGTNIAADTGTNNVDDEDYMDPYYKEPDQDSAVVNKQERNTFWRYDRCTNEIHKWVMNYTISGSGNFRGRRKKGKQKMPALDPNCQAAAREAEKPSVPLSKFMAKVDRIKQHLGSPGGSKRSVPFGIFRLLRTAIEFRFSAVEFYADEDPELWLQARPWYEKGEAIDVYLQVLYCLGGQQTKHGYYLGDREIAPVIAGKDFTDSLKSLYPTAGSDFLTGTAAESKEEREAAEKPADHFRLIIDDSEPGAVFQWKREAQLDCEATYTVAFYYWAVSAIRDRCETIWRECPYRSSRMVASYATWQGVRLIREIEAVVVNKFERFQDPDSLCSFYTKLVKGNSMSPTMREKLDELLMVDTIRTLKEFIRLPRHKKETEVPPQVQHGPEMQDVLIYLGLLHRLYADVPEGLER
jgi:hypothetical protein